MEEVKNLKICSRCNEAKPYSDYQKDYRREGKAGFYQNPCKSCRKKTVKNYNKLKLNIEKDWYIRHLLTFRSKLKKENLTPELIESYRAILKINHIIENNSKLFLNKNHAYCVNCKKVHALKFPIDFVDLQKILKSLTEIHQNCEYYEP